MGNRIVLSRLLCVAAALCFSLSPLAHGQASPGAVRTQSIDVYAGGVLSESDYNSTDKGFLVGSDFRYHLRPFDLALDVRYNHATGSRVGESLLPAGSKSPRPWAVITPTRTC